MAEFIIPYEVTVYGTIAIEADNVHNACNIVENDIEFNELINASDDMELEVIYDALDNYNDDNEDYHGFY